MSPGCLVAGEAERMARIVRALVQPDILRKADNTTKFDSLPGGEEMVRRKLVELYRQRRR